MPEKTEPHKYRDSGLLTGAGTRDSLIIAAYALMVLFLSFLIYGYRYSYSPGLFWDENYHVASAQKYIDGVFFIGDHPPLGKELIALGEIMLRPNRKVDTSSFLTVEKINEVPPGYSLAGMRFIPSFLGVLGAGVFFFLVFALIGEPHLSFLFSGMYLFENAFIVHSRGAMLDSIEIFFLLAAFLSFALIVRQKQRRLRSYFVLGMLLGAAVSVKLNAALFVVLPLASFFVGLTRKERSMPMMIKSCLVSAVGFLIVFIGSYIVHIYLTPSVLNNRYYDVSAEYRTILDAGQTRRLGNIPAEITEQLLFIPRYQEGVPKYSPDNKDENGSLPYMWPVMQKTINYRWQKGDNGVRYLYLVGNPLLWLTGLLAIAASTGVVVSKLVSGKKLGDTINVRMIVVLTGLYWLYMAAMMRLERVMYLYHYFIPLAISYVLVPLLYARFCGTRRFGDRRVVYIAPAVFIVAALVIFIFFSPLTYYQPLASEGFQLRNWFPWWRMEAVR